MGGSLTIVALITSHTVFTSTYARGLIAMVVDRTESVAVARQATAIQTEFGRALHYVVIEQKFQLVHLVRRLPIDRGQFV